MDVRVIGISGSPVRDGNVEALLQRMLDHAAQKGALVEAVHLSQLDIRDCIHCNYCIKRQQPGRYCAQTDGAQALYEKLEDADIVILASPVYFMRMSARMAAFIDRLRVFVFGNLAGGRLKNKIGVSAAVAWGRHGGFETTHLAHITAFLTLEMIPTSVHDCISPLGASAVASPGGMGLLDKSVRLGVELDAPGLHSALAMVDRALDLARLTRNPGTQGPA